MKKILNIIIALMVANAAMAEAQKDNEASQNVTAKSDQDKPKEKKKKSKKADDAKLDVVEASTLYIYGTAYSPMDSVIYITDELMLNNAQMYKKTKFLYGREQLSRQLKTHLAQKDKLERICAITFAGSVKDLDKKYAKHIKKLKKSGFLIKSIGQNEFRFNTVRWE